MGVLDAMLARRSVRTYTGEPVAREQLEQILQAGLVGPSGRNLKPWEFVVVQDRAVLEALASARAAGAGKTVSEAEAVIAVFADTLKTDVWCEDCSIAMANMHLAADSMGLGGCWIQGRLRETADGRSTSDYVRDLLGVPEGYELEALLTVGVPKDHPAPHTQDEADLSKVHWGRF